MGQVETAAIESTQDRDKRGPRKPDTRGMEESGTELVKDTGWEHAEEGGESDSCTGWASEILIKLADYA